MASDRDQIFGIDFSGAQTPGTSIWITEATRHGDRLEVEDCQSARARFSLDAGTSRDTVYEHLDELIRDHPDAVFGFDFRLVSRRR